MIGGGSGTAGRLYAPEFLRVVAPLHDPHMGCENQAPLLYALVRYLKPATIIEVGGGYTTVFLLQALEDNAAELRRCRGRSAVGEGCVDGGTPMYVGAELLRPDRVSAEERRRWGREMENEAGGDGKGAYLVGSRSSLLGANEGLLHCIDNMAHRFTTAPLVLEAAETLSLEHRLRLVVGDAWKMVPQLDADLVIDFLWLDFGAGAKLDTFLELLWDRINPRGGYIAVHSTLTNTLTRSWLEGMRQRTRGGGDDHDIRGLGEFETLSFLEPHKLLQNSFSLFQKRGRGWTEPLLTKYP
ncbi:unnamed protein product [Phaeothamnion confervicola]